MTIKENPNWIAKMLLFAGLIEVVVGLLHFVIPISTYHSNGLGSLGDDEINFVTADRCDAAVNIGGIALRHFLLQGFALIFPRQSLKTKLGHC